MLYILLPDIDDCIPDLCQNGTCVDLVDNFLCDCFPGYIGDLCEISECNSSWWLDYFISLSDLRFFTTVALYIIQKVDHATKNGVLAAVTRLYVENWRGFDVMFLTSSWKTKGMSVFKLVFNPSKTTVISTWHWVDLTSQTVRVIINSDCWRSLWTMAALVGVLWTLRHWNSDTTTSVR